MKYVIDEQDLTQRFKDHNILVRYLRNALGFKIGAVVAIGPGQVGWSMVHGNDTLVAPTSLYSAFFKIPILDNLIREVDDSLAAFLEGSNASALKSVYTEINIPDFDRFQALKLAINRAISNSVKMDEVPHEILGLLTVMKERSIKYWEVKNND